MQAELGQKEPREAEMNENQIDPIRWLARKVPDFHDLSDLEKKAISDFCILWSLFEAQCLNERGNITKIARVVHLLKPRLARCAADLDAPLAYFQNRYVERQGFTYRFELLHFRAGDRRQDVEAVLQGRVRDTPSVMIALLIIVYRFRNNLFHGPKWRYSLREQLENFRTANSLLMLIMDLHSLED